MTLDQEINQLLVDVIFESVLERTLERLQELGVEVK
jgi:hypothetical protein